MYLLIKQHIGISKEDGELVCTGHIVDNADIISALIPKIDQLTSTGYKTVREVKSPDYPYCIEAITEAEEVDTYKVVNVSEAKQKGFPIISTEGYV